MKRLTDGEKLTIVVAAAAIIWWIYTTYFGSTAATSSTANPYTSTSLNSPYVPAHLDMAGILGLIHKPVSGSPIFPLIGFVSSPGGGYLG